MGRGFEIRVESKSRQGSRQKKGPGVGIVFNIAERDKTSYKIRVRECWMFG